MLIALLDGRAELFFDNVRSPEFDSIRENLGQKYYGLVARHPDLKTDVLMPKVSSDLDLSRISKVNITKDRFKPESTIIFATIDGQQQKPIELSQIEAQRYWLVDDKNLYKLLMKDQVLIVLRRLPKFRLKKTNKKGKVASVCDAPLPILSYVPDLVHVELEKKFKKT